MELPLSNSRRMQVEEFDTRIVLSHAAKQARERGYQNFPIIDVDSHHIEYEHLAEILQYMDDPVMRQLIEASTISGYRGVGAIPGALGYQDHGGRVMREPLRRMEKIDPGPKHRDVTLTHRWMDSMGIDMAIMFPTPMLHLGMHPQVEVEVAMAYAYNRWLCERILEPDDSHPLDALSAVQRSGGNVSLRQGVHRQEGCGRLHGDVEPLPAGAP